MKEKELHDIIAAFPGKRVLVVGDVMLDEYIWGEVRRISPEAPVPVVMGRSQAYLPGGAANVASNIANLSGIPVLCGAVGTDSHAALLRHALEERDVDTTGLVVDEKRPTTTKTRILAQSQQVVRVDWEITNAFSADIEQAIMSWAEERMSGVSAFVLSDYAKGVASVRLSEHLLCLAREKNVQAVVDPKGRDYTKYRGATVVTPNIHELEQAINRDIVDDIELQDYEGGILEVLNGAALLITRGVQGMSLLTNTMSEIRIPAVARSVFDVTGAGDTVIGILALALSAGATLEQAARLANFAAGIVVGKVGTATVTREELIACIEQP